MLGAEPNHRVAHLAHILGGAGAGNFDGALFGEPGDDDFTERGSHAGLRQPFMWDTARAQERIGTRNEVACLKKDPRLVDSRIDHVVLLAVAANRGYAHQPSRLRMLGQDRRERLRLTRVLRQPDQRQSSHRSYQVREAHCLSLNQPDDVRAASSRTMKLATWCG